MEKSTFEENRIRIELELDHMEVGIPLTGKLRIIIWDGPPAKFHSIHNATVSFTDGSFQIKAAEEGMGILLLPDALHQNLNDTLRAIYKTINGQKTHYIWYLGKE